MPQYTICPDFLKYADENPNYIFDILMVFVPDNSNKVCIDLDEKILKFYEPIISKNRDLTTWFSFMCARRETSFVKLLEDKDINNLPVALAKMSYDKYLITSQKDTYSKYKTHINENQIILLDKEMAKATLNYLSNKTFNFQSYREETASDIFDIALNICDEFKKLVEDNGLYKLLYQGKKRVIEKNLQLIFFAVAVAFCKANNLKLCPEVDSGNGPVDFNLSKGLVPNINVELKFADNSKLESGLKFQLTKYNLAERSTDSIYLIVYTKDSELARIKRIQKLVDTWTNPNAPAPVIKVIDGRQQLSASKLTS